ncbi:dedicator of cytokinesis protein 1-like [Ornithodoros turicata]|uniref:dedicator of cytokinesis protein 1-like n=1 Tax=Ornithodoros turicata TaxID=34597 RepID=UPI00313A1303
MTKWAPVSDKDKYGVAIANFIQDGPHRLRLNVGDAVYIHEENEDWYYGCCTNSKSKKGIFPKSYIAVKDSIIDKTGPHEVVIPKEPPIIKEITSVLREWGPIWKQLYLTNRVEFDSVRNMMYELMDSRRKIMSGTLPVDELRELKQKVTAKIEMGNAILDLDLVVRDSNGNILNPDVTSTIDLYRAHVDATKRIKQMSSTQLDITSHKSSSHYCHNLFVVVKNFVCRIGDDADLLMTLYDAKEQKLISESYFVQWGKSGLTKDLDQLNNLRVLFTDLGSRDLARERVYFICQIIRIGAMELKETDHKRSTIYTRKATEADGMRRPFGVAAMDITDIISGKIESDEEKQYFVPYVQCGERDFLDTAIKKALSSKEITQKEHKGQGLWICLKLLHGDNKQVREENPHLVSGTTAMARKMGFPEVILPGDVRNDLYLTLVQGEFSKGAKTSDRNIEVTVKVCNEKGAVIDGVISIGCGSENLSEYHSVIYYHEDRPRWMETFKIAVPIELFYSAHLLFTFKHRSSNDSKDRVEKPFAMSFVKLMQENGTTLNDEMHELLVYKLDHKRQLDTTYLSLPATRAEFNAILQGSNSPNGQPNKTVMASYQAGGASLSLKDSFHISTLVCSTKLTQNVDLLGLLKWWTVPENLENNLEALMKVDGEEVVKFLQDILDALFDILMKNSDSELYDNLVFKALIFIICLISDRKYQHFKPVLDLYIEENFSATLAYNKLIVVLKDYIDNIKTSREEDRTLLLQTMKSMEYIVKFIVHSRKLFAHLNEGKGAQQFELSLEQLLRSITSMMFYKDDTLLLIQGACLKYFPATIPDILHVFDSDQLSHIITELINSLPPERLTKQKMMCVNDIVHSELFQFPSCRAILLPVINCHVKLLSEKDVEQDLCVKILSDIMVVLHSHDRSLTKDDITEIMQSMLRTVIQTVIRTDRSLPIVGNIVALMVAVLRQMSKPHYQAYLDHFATTTDLLDFLMEILLVFKDLVSKNVYPKDWNDMIMLQNSVVLKALRHFSHTIRDRFTNPFDYQVWNNFFHCAIAFLTQDALQLENFSPNKRNKIIARYKDMRRETGFEIRKMWFNLGQNKFRFIPGMVGPFLEMTMIPEAELRKATIPIFFDMMQCEFYSPRKYQPCHQDECYVHNMEIKGNFQEFENEMITKLDVLVEGGRGDQQYQDFFREILYGLCENHIALHEPGIKFIRTVVRLMKRLLEYRIIITDENKENRMSCTVNLLEFYHEINRQEMYIRYLHKLCDLHLECDNYVEAGFTLQLHARLLRWSEESLPSLLRTAKLPHCVTHRELKERLYYEILDHFDKGKLWEAGLALCKELMAQCEHETFDYAQLSALHARMATFYDNIVRQLRPEPEYFRVAYYGRNFPAFLQNKVYVYRGKEYERLSDFSSRLLNQFPNAQLLKTLKQPGEEITESDNQYLQINKVDPIMSDPQRFQNKPVHEQILKYYKVNEVSKFTYSRPLRRGEKDSENDIGKIWLERTTLETAYKLPGILRWFTAIRARTVEVSPLQNAIETMESTNNKIRDMVLQHRADPTLPLNPLSMLLGGIVDAAVNGGIGNYEKAFFTQEALQNNKLDNEGIQHLKELIASQIPLLEAGIEIHKNKAPESLQPYHSHMQEKFMKMKAHIEEKYGKMPPPPELNEHPILIRRYRSMPPPAPPSRTERADSLIFAPESLSLSPNKSQSTPTSRALVTSVFVKQNSTPSYKTLGRKGRDSAVLTLRRNSSASISSQHEEKSQSQWYDLPPPAEKTEAPIIELNEQLTPHRPLRSEVEKRHSRPSSGQFKMQPSSPSQPTTPAMMPAPAFLQFPSSSPSTSLSSVVVDEELVDQPPPLPQKQAYADYTNMTEDTPALPARKPTLYLSPGSKTRPQPPLPAKEANNVTPLLPKKPERPPLNRNSQPLEAMKSPSQSSSLDFDES